MNLNGMLTFGWLGHRAGVDVLGFSTRDGRIRKAVDFMLNYAVLPTGGPTSSWAVSIASSFTDGRPW